MKNISDSKKLLSISIPGTHDSGAHKKIDLTDSNLISTFPSIKPYVLTQDLTIPEQLEAGIRYLDIRCAHFKNKFLIYHGVVNLKTTFDDVLNSVAQFLRVHPDETVFLKINEENKMFAAKNTRSFDSTMKSYINKQKNLFWICKKNKQNNFCKDPTLKEARGKVVMLANGFNSSGFGLQYKDTFNVQSDHQVPTFRVLNENKKKKILKFFNLAARFPPNKPVINQLSGTGLGLKAFNNLPTVLLSKPLSPQDVANVTNPYMLNLITQKKPSYVGIVVADSPNPQLIKAIIETNFKN